MHPLEIERHAECDRGEDGELVRGVHPLDVERGIRLRVAEPLRLAEDVGERGAVVAHLGQDEVAGAVDDPRQPLDPVPGQPFAQRLDDRDPAGHRGLERHHHPVPVRGLEDRVAVHRDEGLVRGHHVLAAFDGFEDEPAGGIGAADELDDHVDGWIPDDLARIGGQEDPGRRADPLLVERPCRRPRDHHVASGPARDLLAVAFQHVDGAAADRSKAEHSDPNRGHSRNLRCPGRLQRRGSISSRVQVQAATVELHCSDSATTMMLCSKHLPRPRWTKA